MRRLPWRRASTQPVANSRGPVAAPAADLGRRARPGLLLLGDCRARASGSPVIVASKQLREAAPTPPSSTRRQPANPFAWPAMSSPQTAGPITVSVAGADDSRTGPAHFVLGSTWLIGFIQLDITLLLVWIGVHFGLKPLLKLRQDIESRSARELRPLDWRMCLPKCVRSWKGSTCCLKCWLRRHAASVNSSRTPRTNSVRRSQDYWVISKS